MEQMIDINVLADELLNILQREAASIKEADFAQLAAHTERKPSCWKNYGRFYRQTRKPTKEAPC